MRTIGRLILSAIILLLTAFAAGIAYYMPELFFGFYTDLSKQVLAFLSGITAPFPFAVWELLALLAALTALYTLIRTISQKRAFFYWLSGLVLSVSVLIFLFVALWGLNHFAPSAADRISLPVSQYSREQLLETTAYMAQQADHWSGQVPRDERGLMTVDQAVLRKTAPQTYESLSAQYPFFSGSSAPVKTLLSSKAFSHMGFTGIFIAFTGESCINADTYCVSVPFTMCHELAHRLTVAPEDEANFCAFLACRESSDPVFQYSGWYSAFVYTYNALHKVDPSAASQIWSSLSEQLREDCRQANAHYEPYEGQVQEAAQKINDAYLKAFQEHSGVQSYGEVTDLLIAWYLNLSA